MKCFKEIIQSQTLVVVIILSILLIPLTGFCDDYYVDAVNGNDQNGNGSQMNPWKRLQYAIDSIEGTAENPHTIHLAQGNYGPGGSSDSVEIVMDSYESIEGCANGQVIIKAILAGTYTEGICCVDISNITTNFIGVIYLSSSISVSRCKIYNTMWGVQLSNESDVTIENSIIYNCDLALKLSSNAHGALRNCIIYGNMDLFDIDSTSSLAVSYCCLSGEYPGEGNISCDPKFVDPESMDFRLRKGSPCIDSGDPDDPVPPGGGTRIDMGSSEYQFKPILIPIAVVNTETVGNENGIPENGEEIETKVTIVNWGEDSQPASVNYTCMHADIEMLDGAEVYPGLMNGESSGPCGDGFRWRVAGQSGYCLPVDFNFIWISGMETDSFETGMSLHGNSSHVDPDSGNDETGSGSILNPFQTLNHAIRAVRGSRWMPVEIRAHGGTYSPSTNGEIYPLYFGDYESIRGDGRDVTHLDNDGAAVSLIEPGPQTSIYNLHVFSSNHTTNFTLVDFDYVTGEAIGCRFERDLSSGSYNYGFSIHGDSRILIKDCVSDATSGNFSDNYDVTINGNFFSGLVVYSGITSNNYIGEYGILFSSVSGLPPTRIEGNIIEKSYDMYTGLGYFEFINNTLTETELNVKPVEGSVVIGNYANSSFCTSENNDPIMFANNISINDTGTGFATVYGSAYFINNITCSLAIPGTTDRQYFALMGAYSIDNCLGIFGNEGTFWDETVWCRNSTLYYETLDSSSCERAEYNDLQGCPMPTNIDVDPGLVGTGYITELGPDYFIDETANWEPDKYRGMRVNPSILHSDRIYYCWGNTSDTIYIDGDARDVALVGDLYFIPDFHLRRISDGFGYNSPLIDAGNPDSAYNDPDGSRCDIGPYGGPYARTPMPVIPTWPPPSPSPTATPGPSTTTPTATPVECHELTVDLRMPSDLYHPGDLCYCLAWICNPGPDSTGEMPLFVILEVSGSFFFWPDFSSFNYEIPRLLPGIHTIEIIPAFTWPADTGNYSGAIWYGALTDPQVSKIEGILDTFTFGWMD